MSSTDTRRRRDRRLANAERRAASMLILWALTDGEDRQGSGPNLRQVLPAPTHLCRPRFSCPSTAAGARRPCATPRSTSTGSTGTPTSPTPRAEPPGEPASPTPAPRPPTRRSGRSSAPAAATATRPTIGLVSCSPAPPGRQCEHPFSGDRSPGTAKSLLTFRCLRSWRWCLQGYGGASQLNPGIHGASPTPAPIWTTRKIHSVTLHAGGLLAAVRQRGGIRAKL